MVRAGTSGTVGFEHAGRRRGSPQAVLLAYACCKPSQLVAFDAVVDDGTVFETT